MRYQELGRVADAEAYYDTGDATCKVRLVYNQTLDAGTFVALYMGFEASYAVNSDVFTGLSDSAGNVFSKLGRSDALDGISNHDEACSVPTAVIIGAFLTTGVVAGDTIPLVQNQAETTPFFWTAYGWLGVNHHGGDPYRTDPEVLFRKTNEYGRLAAPTVTEIARGAVLNELPSLDATLHLELTLAAGPVPVGQQVFLWGYLDDESQSAGGAVSATDDRGNSYSQVSVDSRVLSVSGVDTVVSVFLLTAEVTTQLEIGDQIRLLSSLPNTDDFPFHDQPFAAIALAVDGQDFDLVTHGAVDTTDVLTNAHTLAGPPLAAGMAGFVLAAHFVFEIAGTSQLPFYTNDLWETPWPVYAPNPADPDWQGITPLDHPNISHFDTPLLHFRMYPFWRYVDGTETDPLELTGTFNHYTGGNPGFSFWRISTLAAFQASFPDDGETPCPSDFSGVATPVPDPGPSPEPIRVGPFNPAHDCLALGVYITQKEPGARGYDEPADYPNGNLQIEAHWTRGDPRYTGEPTSHHDILGPATYPYPVCRINTDIGPDLYEFSLHPAWRRISRTDDFPATLDYRYWWGGLVVGLSISGQLSPDNYIDALGRFHRVSIDEDDFIVYRRVDYNTPEGVAWVEETEIAEGLEPCLTWNDHDLLLRIGVVYVSDGDIYIRQSDDDGNSWEAEALLIPGGTHPRAHTVRLTQERVIAAYVGGGIQGVYRRPGDLVNLGPFVFADETDTPLAVEDDSFGLTDGIEPGTGLLRWVLSVVILGEAVVSEWTSDYEPDSGDTYWNWERVI